MRVYKVYRKRKNGGKDLQFPIVKYNYKELPDIKYICLDKEYRELISKDEFEELKEVVGKATERAKKEGREIRFKHEIAGVKMELSVHPKGNEEFLLKRSGKVLHSITSDIIGRSVCNIRRDSFDDLISILEKGFRGGGEEDKPNVVRSSKVKRKANFHGYAARARIRKETEGDMYSIEFYPPMDRVSRASYWGNDELLRVESSPPDTIVRVNIGLNPKLSAEEKKRRMKWYKEKLGKYGVAISFTDQTPEWYEK